MPGAMTTMCTERNDCQQDDQNCVTDIMNDAVVGICCDKTIADAACLGI